MAEVITEFSSRFNAQMPRAAPYLVRVAFLMRARRSGRAVRSEQGVLF